MSIVMTVRDQATVLRHSVENVQRQTHADWELLVVDLGSSDDTAAVVDGLAHFDARVRFVPGGANVPHARNLGLAQARGDYVAFLDTDTTWDPDFLGTLLAELDASGDALAQEAAAPTGAVTRADLLDGAAYDLTRVVVRADALRAARGFAEDVGSAHDFDLLLRLTADTPMLRVPAAPGGGHRAPVTVTQSAWHAVVASRHLVDWEQASARPRDPELTSVVMPVWGSLRATLRWVNRVAAWEHAELVVGPRLPAWQHAALRVVTAAAGNARFLDTGADYGPVTSLTVGAADTTGAVVVLVTGRIEPDHAAVGALVRTLHDDPSVAIAQAVDVDRHGVVSSAGAVFGHSTARPEPFLWGHSVDDVRRFGPRPVPAVLGSLVAVRAHVFTRLRGLDPLAGERLCATELSLRARAESLGEVTVCPEAMVTTRAETLPPAAELAEALAAFDRHTPAVGSDVAWQLAGFEVVGRRLEIVGKADPGPLDTPMLRPRTVVRPLVTVDEPTPSLRWTIDLAAPAGAKGRAWGDTHFGAGLADALRRLGQHVCVDPREARHRWTRSYDDVVLVLRGLDRVAPRPECVNVEWVISHPELVTAEEVTGFDLVYAASSAWAARRTSEWGTEVRPLLQATDPLLFNPGRAPADSGTEVLFVGNSRWVRRPVVDAALAAGLPVEVHGRGWDGLVPEGVVVSPGIANADLGAAYAGAGVVLNDHWDDMREEGFVSNRLMDAAACGARVVSDPVAGVDLDALFHGLVRTFEDAEDLARIVTARDREFPDPAERVELAHRVAAEHCFDARAAVLLDDVLALMGQRGLY